MYWAVEFLFLKERGPFHAAGIQRNGHHFPALWLLFFVKLLKLRHHLNAMPTFARPEDQQRIFRFDLRQADQFPFWIRTVISGATFPTEIFLKFSSFFCNCVFPGLVFTGKRILEIICHVVITASKWYCQIHRQNNPEGTYTLPDSRKPCWG